MLTSLGYDVISTRFECGRVGLPTYRRQVVVQAVKFVWEPDKRMLKFKNLKTNPDLGQTGGGYLTMTIHRK